MRSATAGTSADEAAAAPFTHGRWLFSHNGRLHDWATARKALTAQSADVPDTRVGVDSALLFGLALARWQAGASLPAGLAGAARDVLAHGGGRLTMLASDGESVAAVVVGEPLHVLREPDRHRDRLRAARRRARLARGRRRDRRTPGTRTG